MAGKVDGLIVYTITDGGSCTVDWTPSSGETVAVYALETDGSETRLQEGSDYIYRDGAVTLKAKPEGADRIAIMRVTPARNEYSFINGRVINADTMADAIDRLFRALQENRTTAGRGMLRPLADYVDGAPDPVTLPPADKRASSLIGFDSTGNQVQLLPFEGIKEILDRANDALQTAREIEAVTADYMQGASDSKDAAVLSEQNAKASENAAKASQNAAKASEEAAKASENAAAKSRQGVEAYEQASASSAAAAKASEEAAAEQVRHAYSLTNSRAYIQDHKTLVIEVPRNSAYEFRVVDHKTLEVWAE